MPPCAVMSSTQKKLSDVSVSSHEGGCSVQTAEVGVVSRALAQRGWSGLGRAECKGQDLWGCGGGKRSRRCC